MWCADDLDARHAGIGREHIEYSLHERVGLFRTKKQTPSMEACVDQFIRISAFAQQLFDQERTAEQAAVIMQGIWESRSARLADISQHMPGKSDAAYKAIQRFVKRNDAKAALMRLFQPDAPFVIADPTEIPRPQAYKTHYVGKLKDGQTRGFCLLVLATPYRGRAIPFSFLSYSSLTIALEERSRNINHWRAFDEIKALLGERPLVLDREFSYLEMLQYLVENQLNFVIRLKLGSHQPVLLDAAGKRIALTLAPGQRVSYRDLLYREKVKVQVVGVWHKGNAEPLWVMTNLEPERGLDIYLARMKIEEAFKDLKSLLGLDKLMNKRQDSMEQMAALVMLAFTIGYLLGEAVRDELFDPQDQAKSANVRRKWRQYSGLFLWLKRNWSLSKVTLRRLLRQVLDAFARCVQPPVRIHV